MKMWNICIYHYVTKKLNKHYAGHYLTGGEKLTFTIILLVLLKPHRLKPEVFIYAAHQHKVAHIVDVNK